MKSHDLFVYLLLLKQQKLNYPRRKFKLDKISIFAINVHLLRYHKHGD